MVPYPEEVDVFSGPHTRMKELIHLYLQKLSSTDFTDLNAVLAFLPDLQRIFTEFKSHENIENELIMRKLKTRLKALSINDAAVCNCHSDNSLSEMLELVKKGYQCHKNDCLNYIVKLRRALHEFTDAFLPHMKEEEEVFQPMLIQYFDYEELKTLKTVVVQRHELWEQDYDDENSLPINPDPLSQLPLEMNLAIFSHLDQSDLIKCQRVCRRWRELVLQPSLWRDINITDWIMGITKNESCYPFFRDKCLCRQSFDLDVDLHGKQNEFVSGFVSNLLPVVSDGVCKLILSGVVGLTSQQLRTIICLCPNISYLDVSYTTITDVAFRGNGSCQVLSKIDHVDLSGCCNVTDSTLANIANTWQLSTTHVSPNERGLQFLSLSGCHRITDIGFTYLSKSGILAPIIHLDLSGCFLLSGIQLQQVVLWCPRLPAENLYYCFNVDDGPFQCDANGCNNMETPHRFCCADRHF